MATSQSSDRSKLFGQHVELLQQRYAAALERCNAERVIVFAGMPRLRDRDDQAFPFTADPYFAQWVPLADAAGSLLEIRPGHRPKLVLVDDEDFWHAPAQAPAEHVLEHIDVMRTSSAQAADCLAKGAGHTLTIGPASCPLDQHDATESPALLLDLDYDRATKTAYEIDCMAEANRVAAVGHTAVAEALQDGVSEFELHMRYCSATTQTDDELPYPSIIGLNEHAATLHYQHRERKAPADPRSLLIDAGARVEGYASDVTRTHSLGPGPFRDLIGAMDVLQQKVCERATAGTDFVELNDFCHELLAGVLEDFGLIECSAAAACESGVTSVFLPHGLGHLLGLQVHDVGGRTADRCGSIRNPPQRHPFLRLTRKLEQDMVVTIEPGIYFIERLIVGYERENPGIIRRESLEPFWRCGGIRIEDNLQVESRGNKNMTRIAFGE